MSPDPWGRKILLLALILANIALQLGSALLMKVAATMSMATFLMIAGILAVVCVLNLGRFAVWGAIHRRFPVSYAYPLSGLFFPAVVMLAWIMGEHVGLWQVVGVCLVVAGVSRILMAVRDESVHESEI